MSWGVGNGGGKVGERGWDGRIGREGRTDGQTDVGMPAGRQARRGGEWEAYSSMAFL